jgi:hypothetical protein
MLMISKLNAQLGFEFSLGRFGEAETSDHLRTCTSPGLMDRATSGTWGWGASNMAPVADLTTDKLLTPEGALQVKVVVYKTMP